MGNSHSTYKGLSPALQTNVNELYKKYFCRYEYVKQNRTGNEPEDDRLFQMLKSINAIKIHGTTALVDFIPKDIRKKLENECTNEMTTINTNFDQMEADFTEIAQKIKTETFSKESQKQGFVEMEHLKSDGGSKKSRKARKAGSTKKSRKARSTRH